jgi:glutaminyl-peptide cyclotransferase
MRSRARLLSCLAACLLAACSLVTGPDTPTEQFDGDRAYSHVLNQCAFGARHVGSEGGQKTASYIQAELEELGWTTHDQRFTYRGTPVRNVIARSGRGPLIILGAHYDTRSLANRDPVDPTQPVPGANDGASGVAVLLELARTLDLESAGFEVWLAFFDAEDQGGIDGWPFSVGSSYMAQHLSAVPEAVVIVDMIGDADQEILWERNSDQGLMRQLWSIAADLGYEAHFVPEYGHAIVDDHVPFLHRELVAVDIIDFDYAYWHTSEDTPDKVSPDSLERVGRVLETWLEGRE